MSSEELGEIKETKEKNITRVISWRDPMLTHIRREMYSNYGEAWTNPIIKGGMVSGYVESGLCLVYWMLEKLY